MIGVAGRAGCDAAAFLHVPAGQERAWAYVNRYIAPWRSGMAIGRCFPTVETVPRRWEGEDENGA